MPPKRAVQTVKDREVNTAKKRKSSEGVQGTLNFKRMRTDTNKPRPQQRSNMTKTSDTASVSSTPSGHKIHVEESQGDIFAAPPNTLLIHACNCESSWGAGIAKAFKDSYPAAFEIYADHCEAGSAETLLGTALLIPPAKQAGEEHFVGCLFTSKSKGKKKDSPTKILNATGPAMGDLLRQVEAFNAKAADGEKVGEVRMCRINSGLFSVPWEKTKAVIEGIDVGDGEDAVKVVKCVSRD